MLFATYLANNAPLIITNNPEDGLLSCTTANSENLLIDRYFVSTPIEICDVCHTPLVVVNRNKQVEFRCPNASHHNYSQCNTESHNKTQHNRATRRNFRKQAATWRSRFAKKSK